MTAIILQNHYQTLGISKSATAAEVKEAYFRLCKEYHPDRHSNDERKGQKFLKINEAYTVLSNSRLRREYDSRLLTGMPRGKPDYTKSSAYREHPYARHWGSARDDEWTNMHSQNNDYGPFRRDPLHRYWDAYYKSQRSARNNNRAQMGFQYNYASPFTRASQYFISFVLVLLILRYYAGLRAAHYRSALDEIENNRHDEVKQRAAEALAKKQQYEQFVRSQTANVPSGSKLEDA